VDPQTIRIKQAECACIGGLMEFTKNAKLGGFEGMFRGATFSLAPPRLLPSQMCQKLLANSQPALRAERFGFTSAPTRVRRDPSQATGREFTYASSIFPRGS
jgi:hypothetical protein